MPVLNLHSLFERGSRSRSTGRNPINAIPMMNTHVPGHIDIPRLREGRLGAAFWTVWTPCPSSPIDDPGLDFTTPTNAVRDAIEMADLIHRMIEQLPDLEYARSSADILKSFNAGKVASLIGMEGTHFLGNSLGVLRVFAQLGVRYVTLTHICHSTFASSNGAGGPMKAVHDENGLSSLGKELIRELNRVGIMVDLSHTSDRTMKQAISLSKAPVVLTHAGSRAVWDHPRNVPDDILRLIGDGAGKNPGVIQSVFYPPFIGPIGGANVSRVADHIEHIANIVGRKHVGISSDFDGMYSSVEGLEDATKYPNLVRSLNRISDPLDFIAD
jgi:membrane dipeptidase